MEIKELLKFI